MGTKLADQRGHAASGGGACYLENGDELDNFLGWGKVSYS